MKNAPPKIPTDRDKRRRAVSPRVDGKRPRLKPPALNVEEHVRSEELTITNPGPEGIAVIAPEVAPPESPEET